MCRDCGCGLPENEPKTLQVLTKILKDNDEQALHNRQHFDRHRVLAVNLMSSPGAGKTTLLEKTVELLNGKMRVGVVEGDLETENDAERLRKKGVPAYQITTGTACHLDAHMLHRALHHLPLHELDLLFVENVGNLVCPASYDLGTHLNVVLFSVTEGEDKPEKYPVMFKDADLVLLTKTDLLPYLDFDPKKAERSLRKVNARAPLIPVSAKTGEGLSAWVSFLEQAFKERFA
ncbi:MAG: hydrogenase nickel incorporation protein HypB [Aquificae bacterium]|nr:hydrogenase nickel incorporation protein HypB [Aquificota bacterium]